MLARSRACTHGSTLNPLRRGTVLTFNGRPVTRQWQQHSSSSHGIEPHNPAATLSGRNIAIKDNIVTKNLPSTAASHLLREHASPFEATVVKHLRSHGANIPFKTDLDEFGMGSHTQHSAIQSTVSPYSRGGKPLSPGGSSGGSAVAVATGKCWAALGTDTGGSVRLPASYTGTVGFKPSYGRLSRWGVIQYANSLDTVGILSRDVAAARQIFSVLDQFDEHDPSSLPQSLRDRIRSRNSKEERQIRIGVPAEYNILELSEPVRKAWQDSLGALQAQGCEIVSISQDMTDAALSAYYIIAPAEASSNLAKYDGIRYGKRTLPKESNDKAQLPLYARTRGTGLGREVQRRILLGAYTLSSTAIDNYFIQAQKVRRRVQNAFDNVFALSNPLLDNQTPPQDDTARVDVILTPTAPTLPPTIEQLKHLTPTELYMNDIFTVPASLAGLPAISIPVPIAGQEADDVQTVGMQIMGQFGDDDTVLHVAEMLMGK